MKKKQKKLHKIKEPVGEENLLVYFHGNSEDVGHNLMYLMQLREMFGMSVLAMEYPGYGCYTHAINEGNASGKAMSASP